MEIKKSPKSNLENFSKIFMQIGLVLALFVTYVAIDWFSKKCTDSKFGIKIDTFTRANFKSGQFKNCGKIRFCNERHINQELFGKWKCDFLRENITIYKSKKLYKICTYDFVMKKYKNII